MKQATLPALLFAALAAAPVLAADEPVVVFPHERHAPLAFTEHARHWNEWEFADDLRSELGAMYAQRIPGKVVKGAPYSADVLTETRQMLADGNDITRRKTGAIYRDGEGRTRQETGDEGKERTIFIKDPVARTHYVLKPGSRRAVSMAPRPMSFKYDSRDKQVVRMGDSEIRVEDGKVTIDGKEVTPGGRIEVEKNGKKIVIDGGRVMIDGKAIGEAPGARHVVVRSVRTTDGKDLEEIDIAPVPPVPPVPGVAPVAPVPPVPPLPGVTTLRFESTAKLGKGVTTSLGVKDFDGVKAEGKSTTWTIPAGKIGNRNPITVMSETWYSPDLQVTVYSRHSDPRTGESTYKLANIRRGEPSADLFKVPDDYKVRGRAPKG